MGAFEGKIKDAVRDRLARQEEQRVNRFGDKRVGSEVSEMLAEEHGAYRALGAKYGVVDIDDMVSAIPETEEEYVAPQSEEEQLLMYVKQENMHAAEEYRFLANDRRQTEDLEDKFLQEYLNLTRNGLTSSKIEGALSAVQKMREKQEKELETMLDSNPELWYVHHLLILRKYKRALQRGELVKTPYVQHVMDQVLRNIYEAQPVYLTGHTGGGKTELAKQAAKESYCSIHGLKYGEDREEGDMYYLISGDENVTRMDLFGRYVLDSSATESDSSEKVVAEAEARFQDWLKENEHTFSGSEGFAKASDREWDTVMAKVNANLQKGGVSTKFEYGPVYKAMEEGKVLIIDEANAIPHETLISLNHILSSVRMSSDREKSVITLRHNGGKEVHVKKGFNVIFTGNLETDSSQAVYVGTKDISPALRNRMKEITYDYLPQHTEGSLVLNDKEEERTENNKWKNSNELFHLFLAKVMDRKGNIHLSDESMDKLWDLAKASRVLQDNFSGKKTDIKLNDEEFQGSFRLEKYVPSVRNLINILDEWQKDAYRKPLDYYLEEYVNSIPEDSEKDRKFIRGVFHDLGNFFRKDADDDISFNDSTKKFIYKEKTAEYAFGQPPEHVLPDIREMSNEQREQISALDEQKRVDQVYEDVEFEIHAICPP